MKDDIKLINVGNHMCLTVVNDIHSNIYFQRKYREKITTICVKCRTMYWDMFSKIP